MRAEAVSVTSLQACDFFLTGTFGLMGTSRFTHIYVLSLELSLSLSLSLVGSTHLQHLVCVKRSIPPAALYFLQL